MAEMTICDNCIHDDVCGKEGHLDEAMIFCADAQPVKRWISVDDRLPEEIGYYLVVIGNEMLISIDIAEYSEGYWHKHDKVLYWQPLPDYPESTKG
jgi:hypothetical protein